jgi:hypothetical protein
MVLPVGAGRDENMAGKDTATGKDMAGKDMAGKDTV